MSTLGEELRGEAVPLTAATISDAPPCQLRGSVCEARPIWRPKSVLALGLIGLAIVLNYADRQIIAVLKPMLQEDLHWTDGDYGLLTSTYQFASAIAFLGTGWAVDRIGWRRANPIAVALWSLAEMAHAIARTVGQFTVARGVLGATEAFATPMAIKTATVLFPNEVRALAFSVFNAASNLGAIITPLVVPLLALSIGWENSFLVTGGLGLLWTVAWLLIRPGAAEPADHSPPPPDPAVAVPLRQVLRDPRTWAVAGARVLSDNVWWMLLYWLPDLFHRVFHLGLAEFGRPVAAIYAAAATGAIFFGFVSTRLLRAGISLNATRKGVMLTCALLITPVCLAPSVGNYWLAAAILGLTLAAHQGFSVNIFALAADTAPPDRVATVVAIAAFCGNMAGMVSLQVTGWVFDHGYGYTPLLAWASISYLLGVGWVQLMLPRIEAAAPTAA